MPKLKTARMIIRPQDQDGREMYKEPPALDFNLDIYVSQGGDFTATLPEDVAELIMKSGIELRTNGIRGGRKGFFTGGTFNELMMKINGVMKQFVSKTLISEMIIIKYNVQSLCRYATDGKDFTPYVTYSNTSKKNEVFFKDKKGTEEIHATNPGMYGFSVYTKPVWRRIYRYANGLEKTFYEGVYEVGDHQENLRYLLNIHCQKEVGPLKEIPYTEETAAFFVNIYKAIFKINEMVVDKVSPEAIGEIVANNQKLLF